MCCGKFMAFFVFGIIVVPVAVFTISAFFALILWGLECSEAVDKSCTWEESDCICSYYQWWIYIVGNLVGVSITDVGPEAGHVLAELIDLLIAVWSLTVAGLVIGLVGSTGTSTSSHLHYEVHKDGRKVNPAHYYFNDLSPDEYEQMLEAADLENQSLD